ncbi:hypothetical protein BDU57DRAFT_512818 [Ampelomyces quisqualis]|uniref:Uncharacterized protein n=1 Tax=Ampelomyces quisqualis TaxID=50730 RepID=A0A6A5QUY9_AMPQU|nr:hypothetical protein BDU57DRAFT_512818 [Ampelomyces quisqualis]
MIFLGDDALCLGYQEVASYWFMPDTSTSLHSRLTQHKYGVVFLYVYIRKQLTVPTLNGHLLPSSQLPHLVHNADPPFKLNPPRRGELQISTSTSFVAMPHHHLIVRYVPLPSVLFIVAETRRHGLFAGAPHVVLRLTGPLALVRTQPLPRSAKQLKKRTIILDGLLVRRVVLERAIDQPIAKGSYPFPQSTKIATTISVQNQYHLSVWREKKSR